MARSLHLLQLQLDLLLLLLPLLSLASLEGRLEDCLEKLLQADLAFWVNDQGYNLSTPEKVLTLYHERVVNHENHKKVVNHKNHKKVVNHENHKKVVNPALDGGLPSPPPQNPPFLSEVTGGSDQVRENKTTTITLSSPPHYLKQLSLQNRTQSSLIPTDSPPPLHYLRQLAKRDLPAIYQRDQVQSCTSASSTSIISGGKAVDFAAFAAGVLTLVLNVNNNINNNNNNNNNLNINAVDSSNIVANFNTNNANQVNIMPPGRRKKRSVVQASSIALLSLIKVALNLERDGGGVAPCQLSRLCLALGPGQLGAMAKVLWATFTEGAPEGERPERCRLAHGLCAPGVLAM